MARATVYQLFLIFAVCFFLLFGGLIAWETRGAHERAAEEEAQAPVLLTLPEEDNSAGNSEDDGSQKRHIRLYQGQLAVYAGPLTAPGELLRQLDTPLSMLPARWLAQISNGGIEFADEEALLMALDSLDEFMQGR